MSRLVDLSSHARYQPNVVGLACGKVTAARAELGLSREDFGKALAHLLDWAPSAEIIEQWEKCTAPPPGDVITAVDILTARPNTNSPKPESLNYVPLLLGKRKLSRDDLNEVSAAFDTALGDASVDDIMRLSHVWLVSDTPQDIEIKAGKHISDKLVSTVEHRVIQLRRADDFVAGRDSHGLIDRELSATTRLLRCANCTDEQTRRLLTATGELAQLAAWVAADSDQSSAAFAYVRGGVLAARAAGDTALAGNIISTLSYQLANNGNPQDAAILARSAYSGARHQATPRTRALLLERIAWTDAKSGDAQSCERALGAVDENFSLGPRDNDPDWIYWLNPEEINVMAGRCYTELEIPVRAEPLLRDAISQYDPTLARENVLYLSWLAESYVQLGEIEEAAAAGMRALEFGMRTGSARADARIERIVELLQPHKSVPQVREFLDVFRDASNKNASLRHEG